MHKINIKSYAKTAILAVLAYLILDYLIHGLYFADEYQAYTQAGLYRSDMNDFMYLFTLIPVFVIPELTGLYAKVAKEHSVKIAVLMSLSVGFMITFTSTMATFASMAVTLKYVITWFVLQMLQFAATGWVIGKMYKK